MPQNVLVTGASGFIGKKLCEHLSRKGYRVTGLARFSSNSSANLEGFYSDAVEILRCDLTDAAALQKYLRKREFEYVVNCGGLVNHSAWQEKGAQVFDSHFHGLIHCIQAINQKKLIRFIQIGSGDQYGDAPAPQKESFRERPFSPYSLAKTAADHFLQMLWQTEQFPFVSLRLFLVYGPGQGFEKIIPFVILNCLQNKTVKLSLGSQIRDFCYIEDICTAVEKCLQTEQANGQILNCASGTGIRIRDVAQRIRDKIELGKLDFGAVALRGGENPKLVANIEKIANLLGFHPQYKLDQGLAETIAYYQKLLQKK